MTDEIKKMYLKVSSNKTEVNKKVKTEPTRYHQNQDEYVLLDLLMGQWCIRQKCFDLVRVVKYFKGATLLIKV